MLTKMVPRTIVVNECGDSVGIGVDVRFGGTQQNERCFAGVELVNSAPYDPRGGAGKVRLSRGKSRPQSGVGKTIDIARSAQFRDAELVTAEKWTTYERALRILGAVDVP